MFGEVLRIGGTSLLLIFAVIVISFAVAMNTLLGLALVPLLRRLEQNPVAPECPNGAISQGEEIYVIDPNLCTECVASGAPNLACSFRSLPWRCVPCRC